ncbi:hypothetical protein C1Y41_04695 [Pantoea sp. ICBG 1758]|uniref:hypothetical protein n=1 Tax=Pantoea sp. ICBG 1758 TaxID=2071682 RepID=UPI000CE4E8D9|nr:hypothetical protein [Pantoea sp. ICBG 1758]PPC63945.1 hypothetical protein C1Y41_04695 [Pantoea sp. ICBG 1758]
MNKTEFFQLLDENHSEIVMAKTEVKTIHRGSVVEVSLSILGYALFTLSRHKPDSQKLSLNEVKFARWFTEWSESVCDSLESVAEEVKPVEVTVMEQSVDLFEAIEFVSMRVIRQRVEEKKPVSQPAKVTQQSKDKEYPQTSAKHSNATRQNITRRDYYLPNRTGMHNLSEIITYVFKRQRRYLTHLFGSHRTEPTLTSVKVRTGLAPPMGAVG